jgi:hypothetical protein
MKHSTLAAGLKAAAGHKMPPEQVTTEEGDTPRNRLPKQVLIGGHFAPEVRRTLLLVQAEPQNSGRTLKQLLGEAINDLCAKYGKPQPYSGDE